MPARNTIGSMSVSKTKSSEPESVSSADDDELLASDVASSSTKPLSEPPAQGVLELGVGSGGAGPGYTWARTPFILSRFCRDSAEA